jgi:D-tyrosyl-tRNA(Tyr) deacylase
MKFVIQRVKEACVRVSGETVGKISKGILVLIGITHEDKYEDLDFAANKLLNIRLFEDEKGIRWKCGIKELNLEILIVSQFTLYAFLKGNKPDFHNAMDPEKAEKMYNTFVEILKKKHEKVQCGQFGEYMEVSLINDGPITINWEYPEIKSESKTEKNKKEQKKEAGSNNDIESIIDKNV